MPALPAVPNVVRLISTFSDTDDNNMINRDYWQYSGSAPTSGDLDTFCDAVVSAWSAHMAPFYTANQTLEGVAAEDLTSSTSAVGESSTTAPGTRTGTANPNGVAVCVNKPIARRYRGGHPKSFLTALVDSDRADVAHWDPTTLNNLQTAILAYKAAVEAAKWSGASALVEVSVSYYEGFTNFTYPSGRTRPIPKLRVGGPVVDVVLESLPRSKIGSQRRRYK